MKRLLAVSLGSEVYRLLHAGGSARIIGSTSKGLFIITPSQEVLFISFEAYRSPITINLGNGDADLRRIEIGEEVELHPDGLALAQGRVWLGFEGQEAWIAPERPAQALEPRLRDQRIEWIAEVVTAEKPDIGFSPLVSALILKKPGITLANEDQVVGRHIDAIMLGNSPRNLGIVLREMEGLLGFGRGLTPSGDDFAFGFLLAINRWGHALGYEPRDAEIFNAKIIKLAERKTTSLSIMFIRQAALGLGDERQMAVIDGIMSGEPSREVCLKFVLEMGNSSGIDGFLGMAAAIMGNQ
ncbi:MAG: DUF2877 domain-containing protein [Anaerolineaceae bacterium]